jgi:SM-20-related protein
VPLIAPDPVLTSVVDALAGPGWCVVDDFLPPTSVTILRQAAETLADQDLLRPAGVGRAAGAAIRTEIRSDRILWLAEVPPLPALAPYLARMEALRAALNAGLQLGLWELEAHLAWYGPGNHYRRHLDRFRDSPHRVVSTILYLNPEWQPAHGGQLRLYLDEGTGDVVDVLPRAGTLAAFLSERFYHEVFPAVRDRYSITGWFRRRV